MSVADQITRLNTAKADIKTAIESHSITVPSDAHIDTYDDYIKQIGDSTYWTHDWKWKRPTGWPNIDTLYDNSPNYCWMVASFDCRRRIADENVMDGFCFYKTGSTNVIVERFKLVDGEFVLANTVTQSSNGTYFELLPRDEGDYVVYRFRFNNSTGVYVRFGNGGSNVTDFSAARKSGDYTVYNTTIMELIVNGSRSMNLPAPRSPYLRRYEIRNLKNPNSSDKVKWANLRNNPSLEYLDATFDTTNGDTAFSALNACFFYNSSLKVLKLNNWNVANVTTLADCFALCPSLERIEGINTWNTAKVTSLSEPFYNCSALKEINVSNWNTALVTTMANCFYLCSSLETIDISGWNTVKVTNMSYMFYRNMALKSLTIGTNFVATALTNMSYMFAYCISMTTNPLSGITWASGNVTNYTWMFYANYALTEMDMSGWNLTKVTNANNAQNVFGYCYGLRKVVLPTTTKIMHANYFDYCNNLETIIVNATTPPTWAVTTTYLGRLHPNYKIYVPTASVNSYKAASGWANAASHIYDIAEYDDTITPDEEVTYDNKVEYIEADGSGQYINTEVMLAGAEDISIETDVMPLADYNYNPIYGVGYGNGVSFEQELSAPQRILHRFGVGGYSASNTFTINQKHKTLFVYKDGVGKVSIDGTEQISITNAPLNLFTSIKLLNTHAAGGAAAAQMRLYSFKISLNGVLYRDMIPVVKDGVGYMYDKCTKRLFGNAGNGNFIIGSVVNS